MIAIPIVLKRKDVELFLADAREGNGKLPAWADERIQWLCENLLWTMDRTEIAASQFGSADPDSSKPCEECGGTGFVEGAWGASGEGAPCPAGCKATDLNSEGQK